MSPPTVESPQKPRRGRRQKRLAIILISGLFSLGLGTPAVWALERFVIPHVEVTAASSQTGTATATKYDTSDATVTDSSYTSDSANVTVSKVTTGSDDDTAAQP